MCLLNRYTGKIEQVCIFRITVTLVLRGVLCVKFKSADYLSNYISYSE